MPNPTAQDLHEAVKKDFFSADHSIKWTAVETMHTLWLSSNTVLVGTIDAEGVTEDGRKFFLDYKTINPRKASNMEQVKGEWRMDPQSLSYGLLLGEDYKEFTVRWAVKSNPPTTQFEWYSYSQAELDWWKGEVLREADHIRHLRNPDSLPSTQPNWPTNLTNCTRFGWNYRCPLYDNGCTKLNFNFNPNLPPRTHNKEIEAKLLSEFDGDPKELVVLSSSSIETWLGCKERFRRQYEGDGFEEDSEALRIGSDFHSFQADYIRSLING